MVTKILIADDHQIVRQGLRFLLEKESDLKVVAEAEDGRSTVRLARELEPRGDHYGCRHARSQRHRGHSPDHHRVAGYQGDRPVHVCRPPICGEYAEGRGGRAIS